jgi:hypothetical protein
MAQTYSRNEGNDTPAKTRDNRFFVWLSLFCVVVVILGFAPTYWLQLAAGTVHVPAIIHFHAAIATAWLLLLLVESWLVSRGKLRQHQAWGLAGISLATLVVSIGLVAAIVMLKVHLAAGDGDRAREFEIVVVSEILGFGIFFVAAIANIRRPDWHKRFMICAALQLTAVGMTRFFFLARNGMHPGLWPGVLPYPPVIAHLPVTLLTSAVILSALIRDKRVEGRVHPAWMWGLGGTLVIGFVRIPLASTPAWFAVANWMAQL